MTRKRMGLEGFPGVFWEVLAAATRGEDIILPAPGKNFAVNIRHRFHYFRKELLSQSYPDAGKLTNFLRTIHYTK